MKQVKLNKLFAISYGNKLDLNKMALVPSKDKYAIAFIARTRGNNGTVSYVEKIAGIEPYKKGAITVALGGSVLSSFLQHEDFYTGQNIAVLNNVCEMSEQVKLYYCKAIQINAFRYSTCGREANVTFRDLKVPDITDLPDYVLQSTMTDCSKLLKSINKEDIRIVADKWKQFRYEELFDIKKGERVTHLDMIPGNTPFISAIDKNNGIREYCGLINLVPGNTISVSYNGSVGEAFYQEKGYWASDDINVLYPKFELNKYVAMFLITLIRREKYRFNYGRKWHKERMETSIIKLPVTKNGTPDWQFMENYIKSLRYSCNL
jgi:hypothetical protein